MQLAIILGAIFSKENGFLMIHILCMISQNVHLLIMNSIARSTTGLIICTLNIDGNLPHATSQGRVLLSLFSFELCSFLIQCSIFILCSRPQTNSVFGIYIVFKTSNKCSVWYLYCIQDFK